MVNDLRRGVENLRSFTDEQDHQDRLTVLEEMQSSFARGSQSAAAGAQLTTVRRALQLMRSRAVEAFDLDREPLTSRRAYGDSYFGKGCLLARRLVEVGVPFVEVYLPDWDTHFESRVRKNWDQSLPQLDVGMSALISDLDTRGLLEDTLVIWMGEFGRTPRINNRAGRDHYARAWTTVLFGGGIRAGQVIGRTDALGATVAERRVGVADFFATICRILGIDHNKEVTVNDRPIRIVERDGQPVRELFA